MDARTKRAWTGLVNYANGNATHAEIGSTVAACMGWVSAVAPFGLFDWIGTTDLTTQAEQYRSGVDILLRFLCSRAKSAERTSLRSPAQNFLLEHGQHIGAMDLTEIRYNEKVGKSLKNFGYTPSELESFKEQSDRIWDSAKYIPRGQLTTAGTDWLPLGIKVPTREYRDLVDPICDFLMSEYQKYLNRQPARRDKEPPPVVPIFVCPSCNKLVMPERTGRKTYCSVCTDSARAKKYRQNAPAAQGRDYQWLYRLKQKEPTVRRVFLRNQKNQERLKQVKIRQKESSRCQDLLLEMHL
ncbi:MAG TPA: hypothetical protein VHF01_16160 [Candidatus Acidoferrum sp.]|nr:hypothetical protein [Candidatus Acidoferrum sp.]